MPTPVKRTLVLADLDAVIVEIGRLRDGGYAKAGRWSLEQMAFHLSRPIPRPLKPFSPDPVPDLNPDTVARLRHYAEHDAPPPGIAAPPGTEPADDVPAAAIVDLIDRLRSTIAFDAEYVDFGARGPVPTDLYKDFVRGHCVHHLSFLVPAERPGGVVRSPLRFTGVDDVARHVEGLRGGYTQTGRWSLPQVCYHCDRLLQQAMSAGPHAPNTPEQNARRAVFDRVLADHAIPNGLITPDDADPPADTPASAVDAFLATLDRFGRFPGPFAPHRLFGHVSDAERRRHQMIHCAHHLSYLVPGGPSETPSCFPKS